MLEQRAAEKERALQQEVREDDSFELGEEKDKDKTIKHVCIATKHKPVFVTGFKYIRHSKEEVAGMFVFEGHAC